MCRLLLCPNCTGQGQSWSCWLWVKFPSKFDCNRFFKNKNSRRKLLRIFLNFKQDVKKLCFDVHFWWVYKKIQPQQHTSHFCLDLEHPKTGSTAGTLWYAVQSGASQHSSLLPVLRQTEHGGDGSSVRSAFWLLVDRWWRAVLGNSQNISALLHTYQILWEVS